MFAAFASLTPSLVLFTGENFFSGVFISFFVFLYFRFLDIVVEADDAVTVAGMTRPKPLPSELLSDLAVSTAIKLQRYRVFFPFWRTEVILSNPLQLNIRENTSNSAKALEQQIAREARFYGALIRLQQNWKVKQQRLAGPASSNEGFTIDLFDNSLYGSTATSRQSSFSSIHIEHDSAGMLAINLPPNSCHSLHFGFLGVHSADGPKELNKISTGGSVFHMLYCEAFNQSVGVNVTGIRENYLQLSVGQGASLFISLVPSSEGDDQAVDIVNTRNVDSAIVSLDSSDIPLLGDGKPYIPKGKRKWDFPDQYLVNQERMDMVFWATSLCLWVIESFLTEFLWSWKMWVPYLHLMTHPTWHSRRSSWTIFMKVPQSIPHADFQSSKSDFQNCSNVEGAAVQVASHVIGWLREEALMVGVKTNQDFLSLTFELEQRETVSLVAHVDPEDTEGGVAWWLVMEDGFAGDGKLQKEVCDYTSEYRKFLGHFNLDVLYSTLMDLVSMRDGGGKHSRLSFSNTPCNSTVGSKAVQGYCSLEFDFKAVAPSKKNPNQDKQTATFPG
ncbi:RNA polymerase II transcription mediators isoform 3 [Hibiscus syriacus]|uniref:RNA polymerase II transcription mediators isoform 3 n=1 Tax=Hibiscus syriacus TaxID=106335 RepID=A0A6A2Y7F4_HIBSY|nr:RNA polymerase II transcription mediators isoform 3 [Hibiscus syriacus]